MAAPEFTLFVKPYLEGWLNGEEGGTPMTAEILNDNYDAFLLALNEWATSVGLILEEAVTDPNYVHTDNNYTTTEKNKLSGVEDNANNYSLPTASTSTLGGVKIDGVTITISNGVISANIGDEVEGNPSGQATVQLLKLKIGNTIYSIPEGGGGGVPIPTGITYDFTYTATNGGRLEIIEYTDGVQTDTDYVSYAETVAGMHPDTAYVGDVEICYSNGDHSYKIISKDSSNVLTYNGINYALDETIVSIDRFYQETEVTGTITENEMVSVENLDDLLDVDISSVSNGQILMYDSTTQKWKNAASPSGTDVEGNPSGTPTAVLSSIRIGNNIFSIPGGGGGGSSVSFTQILATGTKIGTITIDGVPTDIYAPAPPTKTSDLTNDSNFVSDASYVHTDNNYTTTEKNKLADLNQVEANPSSGTSAGDLTSIEIDGTKYNIPSGGGGTTVVANPSGEATANLNKLQVGNDIYAIPSSGGGGGVTYDKGYSTTEQAVCSWTDGTTVYQKTFYVEGDGSTRNYTVQTGITNGKLLVSAEVSGLRWDSAKRWWSPCYMNIDDFSWSTHFSLAQDFSEFNIKANQYAIKNMSVTLRYTKTTDVPFEGVLPLNELSDVDITTPTNGQVLAYNSTTGKWENTNGGGGSASWTDVTGTLAAGSTSITLSSPAITPNSSIEPWTDTYGVVPTNMEVIQSSSVLDKEIVLERSTEYTAGMTIIIKDGSGTVISTETIDGNNYSSTHYVIDGYLDIVCSLSNYDWIITFLKDCEDNGVEKQANDTVRTYYTSSFVTQDIEYFTLGYGVQMTFEARQAALGVKVRVS